MANFLDFLKSTGSIINGIASGDIDKVDAYRTKGNRQVVRISGDGGLKKYSAVRYPNGTTVETRSFKSSR